MALVYELTLDPSGLGEMQLTLDLGVVLFEDVCKSRARLDLP